MIEKNFYRVLNVLLWIVIAFSAAHVLTAYFVERSLWIDEAMLMKSVVTRDFAGILQGFFDDNQSAPPCYMLSVKALSLVFGTSPMALRLYSLLMYFGSALLIYSIARNTMGFRLPLLPVAVIMALVTVQHYATEAKPYMNDVFFSLFAIWLYSRYVRGRMPFWAVALAMGVSVWFSFGALFTMGGICAWHFIKYTRRLCLGKENARAWFAQVLPLLIVALSVALYYFLWALPASTNVPDPNNDNYWSLLNFPLIPREKYDLILIVTMSLKFMEYETLGFFISLLVMGGAALFLIIRYRTWLAVSMVISALMIMVVSWLGMYPIEHRILLAQYVIVWLFALWTADYIIKRIAKNYITIALIVLVIIVPLTFAVWKTFDFRKSEFYRVRHEFKQAYEYVLSKKAPDTRIYITPSGRPAAQYYMGYIDKASMYETEITETGNVIWGGMFRHVQSEWPYCYTVYIQDDKVADNVAAIMAYNDVYILDIHAPWVHKALIKALRDAGCDVELERSFYGTNVWHCSK